MSNDTVKNNTRLTGASTPVIFSNGFELYLSPLSDKDITELDNWIRARYLHIQRTGIPKDADEETKERIERIAQQTAATLNWYIGYGASMMASIDGLCRILYQASRKNQPKLTYDELHENLLSEDNSEKFAADAVSDIVDNSFPEAKPDTKNPIRKKTTKRKPIRK